MAADPEVVPEVPDTPDDPDQEEPGPQPDGPAPVTEPLTMPH
jgi:hypothetical protein